MYGHISPISSCQICVCMCNLEAIFVSRTNMPVICEEDIPVGCVLSQICTSVGSISIYQSEYVYQYRMGTISAIFAMMQPYLFQGSHSTWKNDESFSSHGNIMEFETICLVLGRAMAQQPNICKIPNLLYTADLLCMKQNKNKVLPPYVNSPCHKVADAGNSTSSFSISAILHSCMLGYSCFFYLLIF